MAFLDYDNCHSEYWLRMGFVLREKTPRALCAQAVRSAARAASVAFAPTACRRGTWVDVLWCSKDLFLGLVKAVIIGVLDNPSTYDCIFSVY